MAVLFPKLKFHCYCYNKLDSSATTRPDQSLIWDFPPTCGLFDHQEAAAVSFFNFGRKAQIIVLLYGAATQRI